MYKIEAIKKGVVHYRSFIEAPSAAAALHSVKNYHAIAPRNCNWHVTRVK